MAIFRALTRDIAVSRRACAGLVVLAVGLTAFLIWVLSDPTD